MISAPFVHKHLNYPSYNRNQFFLWLKRSAQESNSYMADTPLRRYIFASDFDQTLTFNDSGYVLAELVGISTEEFERKAKGMAKINLVQQGAELAYLLLHDPEFQAKVRKEHLHEVGKRIRLKGDIELLYQICSKRYRRPSIRFLCDLGRAGRDDSLRARRHRSARPHLRH